VDGEEEEYMTFIADFAAVEDNIGYSVRPRSEVKATPERKKTVSLKKYLSFYSN
jgi:hypothetical protein